MPWKCSVPGCTSNYDSNSEPRVSIFKFPTNENLLKEWVKKIPRANWTPGLSSRVCENHFEKKFVSKIEEYVQNGEKKTFPRKRPLLLPNAVPTIFPNVPAYLTVLSKPVRENVGEKRRKLVAELHEKSITDFLAKDVISDLDTLKIGYQKYVNSHLWKFDISEAFVAYIPDFPKIAICIQIDSNLQVTVYKNGFLVPDAEWNWLLNKNHLTLFSQFENLLNRLASSLSFKPSQIMLKEKILSCWDQLSDSFDDDEEGLERQKKLRFLREQFVLALCDTKMQRRYSAEMVVHSFMIHMFSPACYDGLRANSLLTLPHEQRLLQLSRAFGVAVDNSSNNEHFLRMQCDKLVDREKFVVLQLDEVYVKRKVDYKNGKLYGFAENGDELTAAKTILAILISSAYGNFKEVAALRPVQKLTGADLFDMVKNVCSVISKCGFKIVVIISDNNRVNRNLFDKLCGSQVGELKDLTYHVVVDIPSEEKIFCTYDSVHVMKSWRNNWLKEKSNTFCYPAWDDFNQICLARFSVLRNIYESEKNSLVKAAPKLNHKTVYPNNLERQQVTLALNIFDESTIAAVKESKEYATANLLEIMWKWWNIMNVKNKFVHILKRKEIAKPFVSTQDDRLIFLRKFLKWLERWQPVPKNGGFLTKDTHSALYRQTAVMVQFIEYSLNELKIPYVLPGKIQTDLLEKRFSRYRSLSGSNYNISVAQVDIDEGKSFKG